MTNIAIVFFIFIGIVGCKQPSTEIIKPRPNDTSVVINALLDIYFKNWETDKKKSRLLADRPFGDSVILLSDPVLNKYFTSHQRVKFKVLQKDELCEATIRHFQLEPTFLFFPYVVIGSIYSTDTTHLAAIHAKCALPNFDNEGNPLETPDGIYTGTERCSITGMCGGGYEVKFAKRGDSLLLVHQGGWRD